MRLLIISRSHQPHGGADRIICDLCRDLPKRGWEITLGLTQGYQFNDVEYYRQVNGNDLPIVSIDGSLGTRQMRVHSIRKLISAQNPDIVLSMRVYDVYEAVALEKQENRKKRELRFAVGLRSFEAHYLYDLQMFNSIVDLCITSGKLLKICTEYCGMEPEKVVSIGGGVHPPIYPLGNREISENTISLIYAGRLENIQKRILDLVPFLDELDRRKIAFVMHIAGTGNQEYHLREKLKSYVQQNKIIFHGWLTREELYEQIYPIGDCFIHFAEWEGMTIAPREAMAHGVVPIISSFPGLRVEGQFIDGENCLTFPIGNIQSAVDCVQELKENPQYFQRLSKNAMLSQQGIYSYEGAINAWSEAFYHCLQTPYKRGNVPQIAKETLPGIMTKLKIPSDIQNILRKIFKLKVKHKSPGSEWPTSSGLMTDKQLNFFSTLAKDIETNH